MGNNFRVVLDSSPPELLAEPVGHAAADQPGWQIQVLRGRATLAAMRPLLAELACHTGQTTAMDSLEHLLDAPAIQGKVPYLVLVGGGEQPDGKSVAVTDLQGAVVLHEYRIAGRGARVFSTHDVTGQQTVFAPDAIRAQVAELAGLTLADQGALITLISVEMAAGAECSPPLPTAPGSQSLIATRTRTLPRDLLMETTLDATLAKLGKRTRRNLRYYRRRAEAALGTSFIPSAEVSREQFIEMNRTSTNPAPEADAAWRYDSLGDLPGSMFAGVSDRDGRWLSLVGGRRYNGITEIEWQMNRAGLPRYSLSTVMRSYLLEHEVARGTTKIMFQGGTTHSMRNALIGSNVLDILVVRRSPLAWLVQQFAKRLFPESNFLGKVLRDPNLAWSKS